MLIVEDHDEHARRSLRTRDRERQDRSDRDQPCRHDRMLFCLAGGSHQELPLTIDPRHGAADEDAPNRNDTCRTTDPRHPSRSAARRLSRRTFLSTMAASAVLPLLTETPRVGPCAAIGGTNQDYRPQAAADPAGEGLGLIQKTTSATGGAAGPAAPSPKSTRTRG